VQKTSATNKKLQNDLDDCKQRFDEKSAQFLNL